MATISNVNGKKITKIKYKGEIYDTGGSKNEPITISANGVYTAPDGVGYSPVNVNVQFEGNMFQYFINNHKGDGKPSGEDLFYEYWGSSLDDVINSCDFSGITSAKQMFYDCKNLTSIPYFNTSNCTDMSFMFYKCEKLKAIPQLDTSKVSKMDYMFYGCSKLEALPNLDCSSVYSMNYFLSGANGNLLTELNIDISNAFDMQRAFENQSGLKTINFIDNGTRYHRMDFCFYYCGKLEEVKISNDVLRVSSYSYLYCFERCSNLIKVPKIDLDSSRYFSYYFFSECDKLSTIRLVSLKASTSSSLANNASLKNFVIYNMETIPTISENAFTTNCYHFNGVLSFPYNLMGERDARIFVPDDKIEEVKVATNWSIYADLIKPLSSNAWHFDWSYYSEMSLGKTQHCVVSLDSFETAPQVEITLSNQSIATITNIVISNTQVEFDINAQEIGNGAITLTITGDETCTETRNITVFEPISYSVDSVEGATRGFTLKSNGYYQNDNAGNMSSYAICKISFTITENTSKSLNLLCNQTNDHTYDDYALFSNIDTTLTNSSSIDTSNVYAKFTYDTDGIDMRIHYDDIPVGEHFIYVKFARPRYYNVAEYFNFKVRE